MNNFDDKDEGLLEDAVIVMTDDEGNEEYYMEEEILVVGDKKFAILIPLDEESDEDGELEDGEDAVIAKIIVGEDGEDAYCDPTDEEFAQVLAVYKEREEDDCD
jgi:uncharacterized protein YrzB (UPF0473 family)